MLTWKQCWNTQYNGSAVSVVHVHISSLINYTITEKESTAHCLQCCVTYFVRCGTSHCNSLSVVAFSDQNSDNLKKVYLLAFCLAACQLLWLFALILILSHCDRALKFNHHHRLRFVHLSI
jgi:hypothetical protein